MFDQFHFLRPVWLLLLPLLPLLAYWLNKRTASVAVWQTHIAPALLKQLNIAHKGKRQLVWPLLAGSWVIACVALAGPAWNKLPTPVLKTDDATVFLLDLSPSMLAEDVKPSRIKRAQQKLTDALNLQREGQRALIAYAGNAHLVAPLTDDARTLKNLIPALTPDIMPLTGSNLEQAVTLAVEQLNQAHLARARIVLITDGVAPEALPTLVDTLKPTPYQLHIIGLGDETGAPIPLGERGFAKDRAGNIVMVKNDRALLRQLAASTGGSYQDLTFTDDDIRALAKPLSNTRGGREVERDFDSWRDEGIWLAWLLLPLAAYGFRKNLFFLLPIALGTTLMLPEAAQANSPASGTTEQSQAAEASPLNFWDKLWLNRDQRGQKALESDAPEVAAHEFNDPRWRAAAQYRAKNYPQAIETLSNLTQQDTATADDWYNLGNAHAQAGDIDKAMESYQQALELAPDMNDAKANLELLESIKEQQNQNPPADNPENESQPGENNEGQNQENPQGENTDGEQSPDDSGSQNNSSQNNGSQNPDSQNEQADQTPHNQKGEQENPTESPQANAADNPDHTADENPGNNPEDREPPNSEAQSQEQGAQPGAPEDSLAESPYSNNPPETGQAGEPQGETYGRPDALDHLSPEERQAMEQWLRQVEDDPSGLLRRKFEYEYRERRRAIKRGEWQAPENDAHERW
ncbi:VWA domain-containing protein [Simiduia sp. 21SJ11W-1]|uniref:VWA domain-containing protein n=1 Tax=Simiduia sp. 21SJ11W-1 TaxID=2909669 RepID=UPI00209FB8FF|nr:VWA domain-containing protein [Simiduia sp. 21SJ11W-1]UTA49358.1 VWA domain-containing protein [Simiduia sp. 21SJ11W-1]